MVIAIDIAQAHDPFQDTNAGSEPEAETGPGMSKSGRWCASHGRSEPQVTFGSAQVLIVGSVRKAEPPTASSPSPELAGKHHVANVGQ